MNNNVVEKTLKSIDNIDRLSDLAAISIYNTSHEAIDKFDVMQEHATPEYVEGEFVQESLLTGVLIGAGIIGVAISAFLIIKKIIESKAKGDPNAASNTPEGADLTKPEDIQKLFDKWKTEYFNKYPDLAVDNVKCADAKQMSEYATIMTDSVNQFTDRVNVAVDEYMDNGSEEKLIEHINDIAALIGGADISTVLSSEGRIDQSTIGNLEVSAVAIARSFKDFDGIIKNNIANFEKKAKEKNDNGTDEDGSNSKVSEKTIKQFSDILKKKAEETGKIMVSFRKNVLGGFETAIKAAANEKAGSQTKQQTGNSGNGLTDEQKQRILNIMKVYYPEDEKQINDEINVFDAAESADELKEILDEAYEELSPGKGAKDAFIRIAGVAEQVAAHKHFDWPIRADNYDLKRLDSEDTDTGTDTDARGSGEGEPKTQDNADDQTEEPKNQNTDKSSTGTELTDAEKIKLISEMQSKIPGFNVYSFNRIYDNLREGTAETITKDIASQAFEELFDSASANKINLSESGKRVNEILSKKYALYEFIAKKANIDFSKFNVTKPNLSVIEFNQLAPIFDDVMAGKKTPYQGINEAIKIVLAKYGFDDEQQPAEDIEDNSDNLNSNSTYPFAVKTHAEIGELIDKGVNEGYDQTALSAIYADLNNYDADTIKFNRIKGMLNSWKDNPDEYAKICKTCDWALQNFTQNKPTMTDIPELKDLVSTKSEQPENPEKHEGTPETSETAEDNIREIVQRLADQYGFNRGKSVDVMINQLSKNNNDANALRELKVDDQFRDKFNEFVDAVAKELRQDAKDETSGEHSEEPVDETEKKEETTITPETSNNQDTALNNNDILKTVADKYFDGNVDSTKDALKTFNGMPTTNIIRGCIRSGLNEYLVSGSGSLKETIQKEYDFYNGIFKDANLDIHLPDVPDFSDEIVSKIKHIWNIKGGFVPSTDFDRMVDAILHNSEEPLNQIDESQLKMGSSEESSNKTNETSNANLFTDEEEGKLAKAVYDGVKGLKREFRQEIYNAVTDDGFAEAAKKLYANYADDANKLNQIHTTLIAMAKSIGKESEVPDLPTAEASPKESATPEGTPEAETPNENEQFGTSSEESNGNDIKKISDSTGLDEVKVESIYKILKDNSTPDDVKRAFIINTIGPMIHMPGFNQTMANDGFKINYDNFKKVAEAASIPFEIEQPEISEKDINDIHAVISSTDTEETKLAKIADNLMKSTSEPEGEILNTADTTDAIESANQDQNKPPTQITSDDLIAAKNANINETIAELIAYAINNNKDITSGVVVPAMGMLLNDINERPLDLFEQSQYLKTYNDLVKAFNYFHLDPNQYLDPEKYPDPKSLGILSDEERAEQDRRNMWLVDLADKLFDYLSDNKTIAEFISDKKISEQDVADALKYIGMGDISVPIDENKVRKEMGISELKTPAAPTAQPSSPSNSSTGSGAGSNQQPARKPVNKPGSNQQPARKPVNKPGSNQQPARKPKSGANPAKPGIIKRFGQFLGL